jgi:hypothetical protein
MTDDAGFFRNLSGLATDWVRQKRKSLQTDPETNVDSMGGGHSYSFNGQDVTFEDLRDIKDIRDSGGQVAQLMSYKALLNFGEGAELHVETDGEDDELPTRPVDGQPMTVKEWLEQQFPHLDLLVLELGEDALWYPAAYGEIRENRAGEFKDALPAEPWTILPETDDKGEILAYIQQTQGDGGRVKQRLDPDDIWSIILNRQSARDKTGISEVLRNKDEIRAFKENEQAINQAIELHGFPQRHVKVGKEDGAPVRDDDLRRVRTIFDPRTTDANTAYFTGQDVDVDTLEAHQFDYSAIHEMDMRNLTTALGLPLEAGNVGSDGLGSGKPAELRFALLKLAIKANQRAFGVQFVEHILKPVIRDYSPFECPDTLTLEIADPLEDVGEVADLINSVGDYMTNAEARRKLDLSEPADDDVADAYRSPADIERDEEGVQDEPMGGLFGEAAEDAVDAELSKRDLQDIEDIDMGDYPDAAVENAQMALDAREETGNPNDCGTQVGWERANQLVNGEDLSEDTIERMASFARHEDNKEQGEEGRADCGWMMWKAWGGDEGIAWAEEKSDEIDEAREASAGDTDFRHRCMGGVSDDELAHAPEWDRPLLEMYQGVTNPDTDPSRTLVSFASSGTPEFVLERIREAIDDGAMFAQIDAIPSDRMMDLRTQFKESLGTDDFTLDSITDALMEFEADLGRDEAERIARTESSAVLNRAREIGYEERGEADELFYWTGAEPGDNRQTEACEWLIRKTNPFHGGDPVPLEELRDMLTDAAEQDPDIPKSMVRPESWTIHINERSTFAKAPEVEV